jgi:hypothetical protein
MFFPDFKPISDRPHLGSEITPLTTRSSRVVTHATGKLTERNARQKPPRARLMMLPSPPPLRRNQPGRSSS